MRECCDKKSSTLEKIFFKRFTSFYSDKLVLNNTTTSPLNFFTPNIEIQFIKSRKKKLEKAKTQP